MSKTTFTKTKSPDTQHCDLCGHTIEGDTPDGYTECCNERTCDGGTCIIVKGTSTTTIHNSDFLQETYGSPATEEQTWTDRLHFSNATDADDFIAGELADEN